MTLIGQLSDETFDKYMQTIDEDKAEIEYNTHMKSITDLLGEYTTSARLRTLLETQLTHMKQEYDTLIETTKEKIMSEQSIKATPAKQQAKQQHENIQENIEKQSQDLQLLKYHMRTLDHIIQYKLTRNKK